MIMMLRSMKMMLMKRIFFAHLFLCVFVFVCGTDIETQKERNRGKRERDGGKSKTFLPSFATHPNVNRIFKLFLLRYKFVRSGPNALYMYVKL